jgi:hypothetical protein
MCSSSINPWQRVQLIAEALHVLFASVSELTVSGMAILARSERGTSKGGIITHLITSLYAGLIFLLRRHDAGGKFQSLYYSWSARFRLTRQGSEGLLDAAAINHFMNLFGRERKGF